MWTTVKISPADGGACTLTFFDDQDRVIVKAAFLTYKDAETCIDVATVIATPLTPLEDEEIDLPF